MCTPTHAYVLLETGFKFRPEAPTYEEAWKQARATGKWYERWSETDMRALEIRMKYRYPVAIYQCAECGVVKEHEVKQ